MRCFVTYCVMDGEIANPLGHACLILSYQHPDGKIQILNVWGFYADGHVELNTDKWLDWIKSKIRLPIYLQGSHGTLKKEKVRFLDLGTALHGVSFEISLEQTFKLKKICHEMIVNQKKAIEKWTRCLSRPGYKPTHVEMFEAETAWAKIKRRQPRLFPFDLHVGIKNGIPTLNPSHTCKTMDISLLQQIGIPEEQLNHITLNGSSMAIPRRSGKLERLYIHSEGPLHKHITKHGHVSFFRKWEKTRETHLAFSVPLQAVHSKIVNDPLKLSDDQIFYVKKYISQIQKLEHVVIDSQLEAADEQYRQPLIDRMHELYDLFGRLNNRDKKIEEKIEQGRLFLNSIASAINDDWQEMSDVESVAAKFSLAVQEKMLHILERPMLKELTPVQQAALRM